MFHSARFQQKVFKVLVVLSTLFTFRLIYVTILNHSFKPSLRRKDLVTFSLTDHHDHQLFDSKIPSETAKNGGINWKILEEKEDHYVLKIWKKQNGRFLRDFNLRKSFALTNKMIINRLKWAGENKVVKGYTRNKENTGKIIEKINNYYVDRIITKDLSPNCSYSTLRVSGHRPDYGQCFPHRSTSEDCKTAASWYKLQPSLEKCNDPTTSTICTLSVVKKQGQKKLKATCNSNTCGEKLSPIVVKALNENTGENEVLLNLTSVGKLEKVLPHKLDFLDYIFIECKDGEGKPVMQLLPVPPLYTIKEDKTTSRPDNIVNVNIILLDSVARAHFYRSLPKTIQLFQKWTRDPSNSPAQVYDFELFQSVDGHTAENTHALFTGTLFPADGRDASTRPVGMETLFGHFQDAKYQTMWQEDMCWKGVWGLFTDLSIEPEWEYLGPKLKEVHIEGTGITHASCEILEKYGLDSPFNGPDGNKICFNGKFQHSYYLQHVLDTVKAIRTSPYALPLLSYLALSVGHDQEGLRIQTFDNDLVKYATQFANEQDTLTIFLADHGNTYTEYTVSTLEGRFEMFHPSLFIIVPNKVAKLLGEEAMTSLRTNQRRLITMVDLHPTLMALAGPLNERVKSTGLFGYIPRERTCNDVELRTPNLCVCDGWDSPTSNDSTKIALMEFAIGKLNNKLQNSLGRKSFSLLSSCLRLRPLRFENVRERNSHGDGSMVTSFDLVIAAGNVVVQDEDIFRVEIKSSANLDSPTLDYRMIHYERLSMFGKYKKCADKNVNLKLCICNAPKKTDFLKTKKRLKSLVIENSSKFLNSTTKIRRIDKEGCVYIVTRSHRDDDAFAYEVANVCLNQPRDVLLMYRETYNMRSSTRSPLLVTVPPGSITFAFSATKHISYFSSTAITVMAKVVNVVRSD